MNDNSQVEHSVVGAIDGTHETGNELKLFTILSVCYMLQHGTVSQSNIVFK